MPRRLRQGRGRGRLTVGSSIPGSVEVRLAREGTQAGSVHYSLHVRSTVTAEVLAIAAACVEAPTGRPLTVLSDSRPALAVIRRIRLGEPIHRVAAAAPANERSALAHALDQISRRSSRCPVRFAWFKGHAGHALNETADRLAVLTRRLHQAGLSADLAVRVQAS